jgi:signal transduction histidine kinase
MNAIMIHSKDWAGSQRVTPNRSWTRSRDARSDGAPASFKEFASPKAPPHESLHVSPAMRNFFVALALALVLAVMLGLDSVAPSPIVPVTLLLIATAIGAWIGGFKAAVLTAVLSWLAIDYLLTTSSIDFSPRELPRFVIFFLMGWLVNWLVGRQSRGQEEDLLRARDESKRRAQAGAEELNRLNREFSVSIAHEIRQPLSAMMTNAHACLRWLAAQPSNSNVDEARAAAQRIIRDGDRAAKVVARIRALVAKEKPLRESSCINAVIDELLPVLNADIQRRGVRVERVLTDGLPAVAIDRVQIQQLIMNLVANGLDAMSGVADRPRLLRIRTGCDSERVLVAVEDSGIGLDPATIGLLFDPFFTTKEEGLGMGLAICHSIVESHGGRLVAKPNDGPGATFQFALPIETTGKSKMPFRQARL